MNAGPSTNPYAAPRAPVILPGRTAERKLLEFYWKCRERPPTVSSLMVRQLPGWCLIAIVAVSFALVLGGLVGVLGAVTAVAFLAGLLCGAIARDCGLSWRFVRAWPLIQQLLDWQKIATLLELPADG